MTNSNVLLVMLSDMHSGSNYALFVNRPWQGSEGVNHYPTGLQERIRRHYEAAAAKIAEERKGRRVILVHNGDATEGFHHSSMAVATAKLGEQADIHIEIMSDFQKRIGWKSGDKLYYTVGTECHTGVIEDEIAKQMNAEQMGDDMWVSQNLRLRVNDFYLMFVHHGPPGGFGKNEGNGLRAWLENIYHDCIKNRAEVPDLVVSVHTHQATYNNAIIRDGDVYRGVHGVILPSFQAKTRFAQKAAPIARNRVGATTIRIDTSIHLPTFHLMETESTIPVRA